MSIFSVFTALEGAVEGALEDLKVPEVEIKRCMAMLHEKAAELQGRRPDGFGAGAFGAANTGLDLEFNAGVAHQHVADAVTEMVEGLRAYAENLDDFSKRMNDTDEESAARLTAPVRRRWDDATRRTSGSNYHDHGNWSDSGSSEGEN